MICFILSLGVLRHRFLLAHSPYALPHPWEVVAEVQFWFSSCMKPEPPNQPRQHLSRGPRLKETGPEARATKAGGLAYGRPWDMKD